MKDERGFYWLSKAWYGDANLRGADCDDEIMVGLYTEEGGSSGEFAIRWIPLSERSVPRLMAFEDSWAVLWEFRDLLEMLAALNGSNPTPEDIAELLIGLGFKDNTPRKHKDENPVCPTCGRRAS